MVGFGAPLVVSIFFESSLTFDGALLAFGLHRVRDDTMQIKIKFCGQ